MLEQAVSDYRHIVSASDPSRWATGDALGLGGLLADAHRVEQLARLRGAQLIFRPGADLLESLLTAALHGLHYFGAHFDAAEAPAQRLAFRELGLAIGLSAAERMQRAAERGEFGGSAEAKTLVQQLQRFVPLRAAIHEFWQRDEHRAAPTWAEHEDISAVMLAASLLAAGPGDDGFLDLVGMAKADQPAHRAAKEAAEAAVAAAVKATAARAAA
jgi:hypothetical protein